MWKMSFTYPAEYANSRFVNKTSASVSTIVSWSFKPDTERVLMGVPICQLTTIFSAKYRFGQFSAIY